MIEDEARWAQRIAAGERTACERLLDEFGPRVHRLAGRFAPSEGDAEDLTQESFVALFASAGSFRGEARLATWVYRIALNHALRHRERAARRASDSSSEAGVEEEADREADPARHAARRELGAHVRGALGELSDGHRDVVVLHELHGMTYNECARLLGIPAGTVKSRLFHAFRHLRRHLEPYVLGSPAEPAPASNSTSTTSAPAACGETP